MPLGDYLGKRGGNAGDDYHELWAVRRALELIVPSTPLAALTVEGVLAADEEGTADAMWDGVDAACYFGSDPEQIDRIELAQLKYSGSSPTARWTVARLASADNQKKTNAVIRRLATAWKAMCDKRPALGADGRIKVKLVSNQPVADDVARALAAKATNPERLRLRAASGLNAHEFTAFVAALDLSECGDVSRFAHEERVIVALSALKDGDVRAEFAELREFIRKRMRPESKGQNITAESIFGLFGHADRRVFFPCPQLLENVSPVIPRGASSALLGRFLTGVMKLCLHGAGGEGKTTVLQDVASKLPPGSELIVYDCYGRGTYLDADGHRHRPEDAFLHLANETSARLLLPPLLAERNADHPRRFAMKLAGAAEALSARDPGALLIIAVDAADNAVAAAAACVPPERSFVPAFARLGSLPANVRLLISARTGRLSELDLPADVELVSLAPFTPEESRIFSEARLGPQSNDWHAAFYSHSGGNPRVQRYAIEFAAGAAPRALDYLNPSGKNLTTVFAARLEEARIKTGAEADLDRFCAALTALPRPVPLEHLAAVAGLELAHSHDIILDLSPGMKIEDGLVSFADEDFEYFVRSKGESSAVAVTVLAADRLMALRLTDGYAATNVANLALVVDRRVTLIALVQENPRSYPIKDPGRRGEVHRRRLRAAMHACQMAGNAVDAATLLLEGAHAIKTDEAVHRTLLDHIELSANFSRAPIIALVLRDRERRRSHGPLLLQLAGIDGVAGDRIGMHANFRGFKAWQDTRREIVEAARSSDDGSSRRAAEKWHFAADDVAAMMVGRLHADGAAEGPVMLSYSRPGSFRLAVLAKLIRRLVRRGDLVLLDHLRAAFPQRHPAQTMIAFALGIAGMLIDANAMLGAIERATSSNDFKPHRPRSDYAEDNDETERQRFLLDACDLIAIQGGERTRLIAVLDKIASDEARTPSALTGHAPRESDVAARSFALARVLAGEAVTFERFVIAPTATVETRNGQNGARAKSSARRGSAAPGFARRPDTAHVMSSAKELFGPILALHEVRARILVNEISPAEAPNALAAAVAQLESARRYQHRQDEWRPRHDEAIKALMLLGAVPGIDGEKLFVAIRAALGAVPSLMRLSTRAILERASVVRTFRESVVSIVIESCEDTRKAKIAARDKIDHLVKLSTLLLPLDHEAARHCYDAALSIAGEVDVDSLHALAIMEPLARHARPSLVDIDAAQAASTLAAIAQDAAVRLGDSDHFPWEEIAGALTSLAPPVALAASARFAELDLIHSPRFRSHVLNRAGSDRTIGDGVLAAFLPTLSENEEELVGLLFKRGVSAGDAALVEAVAEHVMRAPPSELADLAVHAVPLIDPGPSTRALIEAAAFQATQPAEPSDLDLQLLDKRQPAPKPLDAALLSVANIDGVASFLARVDEIIAADGGSGLHRRSVAKRLLNHVPIYRIRAFLDIVCAIPPGDSIVHNLAGLLDSLLEKWGAHSAGLSWAREHLLNVIEARLPEFVWHISYPTHEFETLLTRTEASDRDVATRLFAAIERHIETISAHTVFRLVGVLSRFLDRSDAAGILKRHITALAARIEVAERTLPGFGPVVGTSTSRVEAQSTTPRHTSKNDIAAQPESILSMTSDVAAARYLYAELGHIDHRHRWRAAYACRLLARLGHTDLITAMIGRYECTAEPLFSHPEAPFYFLAARLWLMLALARIAWETPKALTNHADWLLEQGERADFPHLLIRAAARQALEGLASAFPEHFDTAAQTRIAAITRSPLAEQKSTTESWDKGFDRHRPLRDDGHRFRFDSMDTLPYWYTPLLRCFADPKPDEFLARAERWIVDRFGVTDDIWAYDNFRGNSRFNRDGFSQSSNGHGSLPTIERYRTHLEWHAMFLAGGELLAEWSLPPRNDEDPWDDLRAWIARAGPTLAPVWLSDLRGPKPLEPELWWTPDRANWLKRPTVESIRRALALDTPDWLALSSDRSIQHGELGGSTRLESALVSGETATSLRLALERSEDRHQYRLAVGHDHKIDAGSFVLKPLLVDHRGDTELDIHDPLRGATTAPSMLPHPCVVAALGLVRDAASLPIWRNAAGEQIIISQAWSDPIRDERSSRQDVVSGETLLIRRNALAVLLANEGLDLITELSFTRRIGEREYGRKKDKSKNREFDILLVFRADGRIETREGNLGRWT